MSNKLLNAILAMDSYNRGYNEGIKFTEGSQVVGQQIGDYTILQQSDFQENDPGYEAGFYGIAYENTNTQSSDYGDVIVSYRGTDDPLGMDLGGSDIWNGWSTGTGSTEAEQAELAFKFYQEVAGGTEAGNAKMSE